MLHNIGWAIPVLCILPLLVLQAAGEMFVESVWGRDAMFKFNEIGFRIIGFLALPAVLLSLTLGGIILLSR